MPTVKNQLEGSCLCGGITFQIDGEIDDFFLCHCSRCRKGTGSVHASNLIVRNAKLVWKSGKEKRNIYKVPSSLHTRSFCSVCGSGIPSYEDKLLVIPAGGIDSHLEIKPTAHIYAKDKLEWDSNLEDVIKFDELPE